MWERTPVALDSDGEGMGGSMTRQEEVPVNDESTSQSPSRVVELMLLLPVGHFSALEEEAHRLNKRLTAHAHAVEVRLE